MFVQSKLGSGLAVGALLLVAGCMFEDTDELSGAGRYDKDALNVYMTDTDVPAAVNTFANFDAKKSVADEKVVDEGIYGHWVAKLDAKEQMKRDAQKSASDPNMTPEQRKAAEEFSQAMAEAFSEMMVFDLTIRKDNTFTMTMMGMPIEGPWTQKGDVVSLVPKTFMGMSAADFAKSQGGSGSMNSEPLELRVSRDGKTLIAIDPKGLSDDQLVFKRA
jgi:hypothetical protein